MPLAILPTAPGDPATRAVGHGPRSPEICARTLLLALVACEPAARPSTAPSPPAPIAEPPAPHPRPLVRSCPAAAKPVTSRLDPRIVLGDIDGVTWLFGYAGGEAVLAHLAADDTLATIKVPLHNAQAGAIEGPRIWLYAPKESAEIPTRWTSVDVTDPDRPILGDVVPLTLGARLDYADVLAVGTRRALVITGVPDDRQLVLLDTATRTSVRQPHPLGTGFEPVHASCDVDRCAVIAITDEGGGPERRLVVVRALADATLEVERLAPDWIGQPHAARRGDQILVAWPDRDGVRLRALDHHGRILGPIVPVPWDSKRWIRDVTLLHADGDVTLAIGERERWSVATVGPLAALGPLRELPGTGRYFLTGAPLADGLAWINVGGDVTYDEMGPGVMTHSWRSEVVAGFLPTTGDPPPPQTLASDGGGGRGGFEAHVLTRPGAAAALVVPRGDADNFSAPVFAPLRIPCKP